MIPSDVETLVRLVGALDASDPRDPGHILDRWAQTKEVLALGPLSDAEDARLLVEYERSFRANGGYLRREPRQQHSTLRWSPEYGKWRIVPSPVPVPDAVDADAEDTLVDRPAVRVRGWKRFLYGWLGALALGGCGGSPFSTAAAQPPDSGDTPEAGASPGTTDSQATPEAAVAPTAPQPVPSASPPPITDDAGCTMVAHNDGSPADAPFSACAGTSLEDLARMACENTGASCVGPSTCAAPPSSNVAYFVFCQAPANYSIRCWSYEEVTPAVSGAFQAVFVPSQALTPGYCQGSGTPWQ